MLNKIQAQRKQPPFVLNILVLKFEQHANWRRRHVALEPENFLRAQYLFLFDNRIEKCHFLQINLVDLQSIERVVKVLQAVFFLEFYSTYWLQERSLVISLRF